MRRLKNSAMTTVMFNTAIENGVEVVTNTVVVGDEPEYQLCTSTSSKERDPINDQNYLKLRNKRGKR